MGRAARVAFPGAKYHAMARGNWRAEIFSSPGDYTRFLMQLRDAALNEGVIIFAYALMNNHYHLFIETPQGNVSRFMQRLNTAYSLYFRNRTQKPGHCFQGRYACQLVSGNDYCLRLTRYIHLNPIKTSHFEQASPAEKWAALQSYEWSSLQGYLDASKALDWVDYRWLHLCGGPAVQGRPSVSGHGKCPSGVFQSRHRGAGQIGEGCQALEGERCQATENSLRDFSGPDTCKANGRAPNPVDHLPFDVVTRVVAQVFELQESALFAHGLHAAVAKATAIELACRYTGLAQCDVAARFGYRSESSVGKQRQRLRVHMQASDAQARFAAAEEELLRCGAGSGERCQGMERGERCQATENALRAFSSPDTQGFGQVVGRCQATENSLRDFSGPDTCVTGRDFSGPDTGGGPDNDMRLTYSRYLVGCIDGDDSLVREDHETGQLLDDGAIGEGCQATERGERCQAMERCQATENSLRDFSGPDTCVTGRDFSGPDTGGKAAGVWP